VEQQHPSQTTAQELLRWLGETAHVAYPPASLVGRLATLIGKEPIVFKDAAMTTELGRFVGRIVVFTATHVFVQTSTRHQGTPAGIDGEVQIQVLPRRALQRLEHSGPVNLSPTHEQQSHWPWPVLVELTYEGGLSFPLPLNGDQWRYGLSEELLPGLLDDLAD